MWCRYYIILMSWTIRLIAPLNGHFKSELQWHLQKQGHVKCHICIHLFGGRGYKKTVLADPPSRHLTPNTSWSVTCKTIPRGTFSSWDQVDSKMLFIFLRILLAKQLPFNLDLIKKYVFQCKNGASSPFLLLGCLAVHYVLLSGVILTKNI